MEQDIKRLFSVSITRLSTPLLRLLLLISVVMQFVVCSYVLAKTTNQSSKLNFTSYTQALKNEDITFELVPIAGGSFIMGAAKELASNADETPEHQVSVDDFWMTKHEVTWQQYDAFVFGNFELTQFQEADKLAKLGIDSVTGATTPYVEMSFGMGKDTHPAINVTHYAAMQFSRWVSAKTGVFHRLPTEAEWEYACKKGQTAEVDDLSLIAWYKDNSQGKYAKTGLKAENALGLHDMLGNVSEWVMDQYSKDYYGKSAQDNPVNTPTTLYPRVVRGGSWQDPVSRLTCTSRQASHPKWKKRDPQIPKSNWWLTNAPFVGFRLVVPKKQPKADEMQQFWLKAIKDFGR
ncbi:formylglycine-generating enzyme family protein [Paraglaciecola sp.]|uniref:formylglycine-generating enzyme family protein n=1 Tax=Paraglaciecola sp. TaxID=1920173 RepID=UPI003EFA508C